LPVTYIILYKKTIKHMFKYINTLGGGAVM